MESMIFWFFVRKFPEFDQIKYVDRLKNIEPDKIGFAAEILASLFHILTQIGESRENVNVIRIHRLLRIRNIVNKWMYGR